jgi:hypothetical protein
MSKNIDKTKTKKNQKNQINNILINKKKFGPEGYFNSLSKKFFFQYSFVPEESILCDFKINNSIKCFFTTLKTYQKEEQGSKYLEEILDKLQKDYTLDNNEKVYILLYLDAKEDYIKYSSKEIIENLKYMIPNINENKIEGDNKVYNLDKLDKEKIEKNEKDLLEINEFCVLNNIKLIVSTNFEECVQCIYQLTTLKINIKSLQSPKDNIINNETIIDILCKIEYINKNDAMTLLGYYKTIKNICIATENNDLCKELNLLPLEHFNEIDERKKKALYDVFHFNLKKDKI